MEILSVERREASRDEEIYKGWVGVATLLLHLTLSLSLIQTACAYNTSRSLYFLTLLFPI